MSNGDSGDEWDVGLRGVKKNGRSRQVVTAISDRGRIKRWTREQYLLQVTKVASKALLGFPTLFRFVDHKGRETCLKRAQRYLNESK